MMGGSHDHEAQAGHEHDPAGHGHRHPEDEGERVAVLLCGYGEVEDNDDLADYNRLGLELLVSKSIRFPDRVVPLLSRRLARKARAEYERANRFISPQIGRAHV